MNPWDVASFEWPLSGAATIVEVGGFEGRWIAEMGARYSGVFHAFEPQDWARPRIWAEWEARALPFNSLRVHPFGLGVRDEVLPMRGWGTDANSFLKDAAFYERHPEEGRRDEGLGELCAVGRAFDQAQIVDVDVMCMNIEGYEFVLLPEMYRLGLLPQVRFLMVQFHEGYDVAYDEDDIRTLMDETHELHWDYRGTLTAWRRRGG